MLYGVEGSRTGIRCDGREGSLGSFAGDERGRRRAWQRRSRVMDDGWAEIEGPMERMTLSNRGRRVPDAAPGPRVHLFGAGSLP